MQENYQKCVANTFTINTKCEIYIIICFSERWEKWNCKKLWEGVQFLSFCHSSKNSRQTLLKKKWIGISSKYKNTHLHVTIVQKLSAIVFPKQVLIKYCHKWLAFSLCNSCMDN